MINSKIHVAIKSFNRANLVTTQKLIPFAFIWVPESQKEDYEKYHNNIITIPDENDGNLCRKSNAILDNSPCDWTLILDDDITAIGMWENRKHFWLDSIDIQIIVERYFDLADQLKVKLWGINPNNDPLIHYTYRPFNLLSPILGPFNGHLKPELRYDESVLGKDDYDFYLQNILKYHKVLRVNKFHYKHDHGNTKGGFVQMRTKQIEFDGIKRMQQKWGKYYRPYGNAGGKSATGKNYLNSRVIVPIEGC